MELIERLKQRALELPPEAMQAEDAAEDEDAVSMHEGMFSSYIFSASCDCTNHSS